MRSLRWFARCAVLGVAVPAVLLSIAYRWALPQSWWLEMLQYAPYPAYLLPALVAFALAFVLGPVWRIAGTLALALVVVVLMGLAYGRPDAGGTPLRLMTYNVKAMLAVQQPDGFAALAREIAAHRPDVLVMQDADDLIAARRADPRTAGAVFEGRHVFETGQYILVSRFPLRDCAAGALPQSERTDGERSHGYLRCTVQAGDGVDFDMVTAHLLSPRNGLNAVRQEGAGGVEDWRQNFELRLAQARKLAKDVADRPRPLVLAGDLNAPETSPVIRTLLAQGLRDAFSSAGRGYGYTHGHSLRLHIPLLRIDHVLVSPEIGVADCFAGGREASEHRPVIADLLLRREPG